jgi:hypothetical protein
MLGDVTWSPAEAERVRYPPAEQEELEPPMELPITIRSGLMPLACLRAHTTGMQP